MGNPIKDIDFNGNPDSFPSELVAPTEERDKDISERSSLLLNPDGASSIRKVYFLENASDKNHMPKALNLETIGLMRSKCTVQQQAEEDHQNHSDPSTSSQQPCRQAAHAT